MKSSIVLAQGSANLLLSGLKQLSAACKSLLNTISDITASHYTFLLHLICLSLLFLSFCVQVFAQGDEESE